MGNDYTLGLPRDRKVDFDPKLEEATAAEFVVPPLDPPKKDIPFLRYIGILVSAFASFVTAVNSYEWWASLRPWWVAVPMAATMVGASVFLPDFGILLFREKRKWIGGVIFFSGVLATVFCMVTTVAALYNTHSWTVEDSAQAYKDTRVAAATLEERRSDRARWLSEIDLQNELVRSTQEKIDRLAPEDTVLPISQVLQRRLLADQATKRALESSLSRVDLEIAKLRAESESGPKRTDFYGFLGTVFKGDPVMIEFLTAAIPAVFLEVVAPVMVAVVLFL